MRFIHSHHIARVAATWGTSSLMSLALLASPVQAQTADSAAAYCATGKGTAPKGLSGLSADAQTNLCKWMKDAAISPERFDAIVAKSMATGNTQASLNAALQTEAGIHGRNASSLAKSDFGHLAADSEKSKQAFYDRLSQSNSALASAN